MAKQPPKTKPDLVAIGKRIQQLRGGALQDDIAPLLGITQGQLSKIESGKAAPSAWVLLRLAEFSGKSVDWILRGGEVSF